MFYSILHAVLTEYVHKIGKINRLTDLKKTINTRIDNVNNWAGVLEIVNDMELHITYEEYSSSNVHMEYEEAEVRKQAGIYEYDWKANVRDFIYPAVVYRTYTGGAIWVRNNGIYVFSSQRPRQNSFSLDSEYSIPISEFSKEDLFGIRLLVNFDFEDKLLFDAIECYRLLKQQSVNFLYDFTKKAE